MEKAKNENCEIRKPLGLQDFAWVDEFIENVREYIFVREEDCVLIKRPNEVVKLNPSGAKILKFLLDGCKIADFLDLIGHDENKFRDVYAFLITLKAHLEGKLTNPTLSRAVETNRFEMKFTEYPVLSEIALTYRCNLKCKFCYAGCNETANPCGSGKEMNVEQVKQILDRLYQDAKVPSVSFTGGEPTLCPDLPELVKYAKDLGMRVNLISNGTLITEELAGELADSGLASAQLSLESHRPEAHDRMTGVKGSYEKTINALGYLKTAGVLTHTNTTINRLNLEECMELPGFVKNELKNERFSMNLIIPTGTAAKDLAGNAVMYSEVGRYLDTVIEESEKHGVEFMWYSPLPMCIYNTITKGLGNKGCSACDGLISIAPNGDVLPCASFDDPVGNLLQDEFRSIWDAKAATRYRNKEYAHSECQTCDNFHICNGTCPLYWRKMGYEELISIGTING